MVKRIHAVYFSAVGNTKKVVTELAGMLREQFCEGELSAGRLKELQVLEDDFTLPSGRERIRSYSSEDLVVFGVPTYAGRVPNKVLPFVQELFRGNGTPVIPVVTFGNRSFDSSLAELCHVLKADGFIPFAAAAAACRHVFSDTIGAGRPDGADLEELRAFAGKASLKCRELFCPEGGGANPEKISGCGPDLGEHGGVGPYYTPLGLDGQPAKFLKAKPKTDLSGCDRCGICAKVCPMGSVDPDDLTNVSGICIKCHACIRKCPKGAKYFDDPAFLSHKAMLEGQYQRRAESFFSVR